MKFSGRWPKAGMMQNGKCYRLECSVLLTEEKECFLWPTPNASNGLRGSSKSENWPYMIGNPKTGGPLNPVLVEWLMNFPEGWTDLEHSEMP